MDREKDSILFFVRESVADVIFISTWSIMSTCFL